MEQAIRQLLSKAENNEDKSAVDEAFQKLKQGRRDGGNQVEPFTSDLYVICAQIAIKLHAPDTATQCMKLYFQKTPPNNEYLCLAYLCQAQLSAPNDSTEVDLLEQCVGHVLKAVNFAKSNQRYYYLVFNASVLYWSFVRPFLKPNTRHYIVRSFQAVVKALEDVDDDDYEWRAELLVSLLECLIDAGRKDEAMSVSVSAFEFTRMYVPEACKQILALQVKYKLVEQGKLQNTVKTTTELAIYYHMQKLSNSESPGNVSSDALTIYNAICVDSSESQDSLLRRGSVLMQPLRFGERGLLLLELARICFQLDCIDVAEKCITNLSSSSNCERVSLQTNFLKCELKVRKLNDQEKFTKHNIDIRLQAISSLLEHLISAKRLGDESLVQMGCVAIWNLSLPLLQTNLRKTIGSHLNAAVEMLDDMDSLLLSLRCQLHFEVAKCEEEKEQLQSAILHLMKALELDDVGSYKPQISHTLERLKLKAILYQTPERAEDHAAMIIEQAESAKEASTPAMMREYLMKVGILLSPDAFHLAMEGEEALSGAKVGQSSAQKLAEKVGKYETGIAKLQGHVERMEHTNDRERVMLWADLVKTARRQKVWDVTRVAAMFCLLYDDNRWTVKSLDQSPVKSVENKSNNVTPISSTVEFGVLSKEHLEGEAKFHENEDVLRLFAEINFIYAEALVELIMKEGYKFLEKVKAPEETKLTPSIFQRENIPTSESNEWLHYTNWMEGISRKAMEGFLRASTIGVELDQSWIVCNAGIYVWNYTHHLLVQGCFATVKPHLHVLFRALRTCGHGEQTVFLCDVAHALARGFMQPYIPEDFFKPVKRIENVAHGASLGGASSPTKGRSTKLSNKNIPGKTSEISGAEVMMNSLKEACEILEYALSVTSGSVEQDIVPIDVRYPLIKALVLCKGLMNQQLPKNYGHDSDEKESQGPMSRALFVLEAMLLQTKGVVEFQQCPSLADIIKMVQAARWTDNTLILQVWSQLSVLSYHLEDGTNALYCSDMALQLKSLQGKSTKKSAKKRTGINYGNSFALEQEMLYYASVVKGQCLVATMKGRAETRQLALSCFVDACGYGSRANNYDLVMASARHIWNLIHPLIKNPLERQVLKKPIKKVLTFIQDVAKNNQGVEMVEEKEEEPKTIKKNASEKSVKTQKSKGKVESVSKSNSKVSSVPSLALTEETTTTGVEGKKNSLDQDLTLRASLYGVLFQAYADKGELNEGVVAMDAAIKVMPRTHHRLLIFKHRVMTNAKLNKPIQFDMGKFCDESESLLAQMWHRVATSSVKSTDQMTGYINAIQALNDSVNVLQKVEYISGFAEWLFVNEYNVSEAIDQFVYAVNLMTNVPRATRNVSSISITKDKGVFDSIKDIRTMDALMRVYIMIAGIIGHEHHLFRQCNLSAVLLVENMWKRSILNADAAIKAGLKPGEVLKPKSRDGKSGSPDHLKLDGSPSKVSRKSATSRTFGSKSTTKSPLPTNLEGWAHFTLAEKFREHFKADTTGAFLSKISISKPELSLYYLELLSDSLCSIGFHHYAIIPSLLMNYIAEDILINKSAAKLIQMHFCDLYEKLRLKAPYQIHQKSMESHILSEEEQATSREKCQVWIESKEKVKLFEDHHSSAKVEVRASNTDERKEELEVVPCPLDTGYADTKHIWCKMAEYLIQQTQYQPARVLLEEAQLCAEAFDDEFTKEMITYLRAVISFRERDWGQVLLLVGKANCRPKSQLLWMKKLLLLADTLHKITSKSTTFQFISTNRGFTHAKAVLQDGMKFIKGMHATSKNRINQGPYIHAKLLHRMGTLCLDESKEETRRSVSLSLLADASSAITQSYQELLGLGYVLEGVQVMRISVDIHIQLASNNEGEQYKEMILKSFDISKSVLSTAQKLMVEITELTSVEDVSNMHLPAQQEMNACQLKLMEVMEIILTVALQEKKLKTRKEEEKKLINRVIDNFVDIEKQQSPLQTKWIDTVNVVSQEIMTMCSSISSLKKQEVEFSMEASLHLGRLSSDVARYDMADELDAWLPLDNIFGQGEDDPFSGEVHGTDTEKLDKLPFSSLNEKVLKYQSYTIFTSQAVESLLHAIEVSLHHGRSAVTSSAALHLLEIVGKRDAVLAVNLLALYQCVEAATFMGEIAAQTFIDPHCSRGGATYLQNETLKEAGLVEWCAPKEATNSLLESCEWWKQLTVSKHALELLKEAPSHVTFVVFQHSADKKFVYASVMEKSSLDPHVKKSTKSPTPSSRTAIHRKETDETLLNNLLEIGRDYTALVCREHMLEAKEDAEVERKKVLQESQESEVLQQARCKVDRRLQMSESFETLVAATEAYLGSLLKAVEEGLKAPSLPESIVILADKDLMELPLEALGVFHLEGIRSVSRDFSLQIFLNRYTQESGETEKPGVGKAGAPAGRRESKAAKPVEKSAAKKNGKGDGGGEKKGAGGVKDVDNFVMDISNLKYLVDPFNDGAKMANMNTDIVEEVITTHKQKLSKWSGIKGVHGVANVKEMQELMESSEAFLFSGFGRLLSTVPPECVAPLNMSCCNLFILLDLVQTSEIFSGQGSPDSKKTSTRLQLENPVETAAILTLCGVKAIAMNKWYTTLSTNNDKLHHLVNALCEKMLSLGESVTSWSVVRTTTKGVEAADEAPVAPDPTKKGKGGGGAKEEEVAVQSEDGGEIVFNDDRVICDRFGLALYGIPNAILSG